MVGSYLGVGNLLKSGTLAGLARICKPIYCLQLPGIFWQYRQLTGGTIIYLK
ncbi:hypothetical protein NSP_16840 [Nodularia spumigena CCY9414]|nr:hypothetical protein NSP_16840 [Nodularia spumigena CCY9414]